MGRHKKPVLGLFLTEVLTSLPGMHRPTAHRPPEDLSPEEFHEISTGEDTAGVVRNLGHTLLGLGFWLAWIVWTAYMWFFSDAPYTDLWIAFFIWFVVFVLTIIGVPWMRRRARNRVRV